MTIRVESTPEAARALRNNFSTTPSLPNAKTNGDAVGSQPFTDQFITLFSFSYES
jgi:hypothetical protein